MKWLKKQIWLPLSGLIFGTYMIQRGLASLAKAGVADHLKEATSIMFTVAGFSALIMGMLCDNIKAKTMLIIAGIVAAIGIALLPYTALGFGLLFGAGAAIFKLVPYSNPLKRKDGIGIFPEGTRNKKRDGSLLDFHLGAAKICIENNVPYVPVALIGESFPFKGKVEIVVGRPIFCAFPLMASG